MSQMKPFSVSLETAQQLSRDLPPLHELPQIDDNVRQLVQTILTERTSLRAKEASLCHIGATGIVPLAEKLPQ